MLITKNSVKDRKSKIQTHYSIENMEEKSVAKKALNGLYFLDPKIIAYCFYLNFKVKYDPKYALVVKSVSQLYISALNRHHSYRQVRFAP